jgi:hypothetical protein
MQSHRFWLREPAQIVVATDQHYIDTTHRCADRRPSQRPRSVPDAALVGQVVHKRWGWRAGWLGDRVQCAMRAG